MPPFDRAIRGGMPAGTSDQIATHLMLLADGWNTADGAFDSLRWPRSSWSPRTGGARRARVAIVRVGDLGYSDASSEPLYGARPESSAAMESTSK